MRIGVISDTHIPHVAPRIPDQVIEIFEDVDLILHAGDVCELFALEQLKRLAPLRAVYGNMDGRSVRTVYPEEQRLTIDDEGVTVALRHGSGSPIDLGRRLLEEHGYLDEKSIQVLVFGHSHKPQCEDYQGILLFNPGSPTDKRYARYHSVGILEVEDGQVKGEIVRL